MNDTHIAAAIEHPLELAAGFHNAFLFGALISLIAVGLMFLAGRKARSS